MFKCYNKKKLFTFIYFFVSIQCILIFFNKEIQSIYMYFFELEFCFNINRCWNTKSSDNKFHIIFKIKKKHLLFIYFFIFNVISFCFLRDKTSIFIKSFTLNTERNCSNWHSYWARIKYNKCKNNRGFT